MYFLVQPKTYVFLLLTLGSLTCFSKSAWGQSCSYVDTVPPTPTYTVISPSGGGGGILNNGVLEQRATELSTSYVVNFNCPGLTTVDLSVSAVSLTAPRFTASDGGLNLDWITGTTGPGVSHLVTVTANGVSLVTNQPVNATGNIVAPTGMGNDIDITLNSEKLAVQIDSRFTTIDGAEEMAEGNPYRTTFQVQTNPFALRQTTVSGLVNKECSIQVAPLAIPYTIQTTLGGIGGTIQDNGTPENRVTQLTATNNVEFDCNSNQVAYSVFLSSITAPKNLGNNLDLVTGSTDVGVDHKITASFTYPTNNQIGSTSARTAPLTYFFGTTPPNNDGDMGITLSSTFETINGAEEMAAGTYGATISVTVTAQ